MATGVVARFDPRRGYGFLVPDDGGEDVFVHQNNINMEGFRYLKPGENVRYELEVGEKGLKAVDVTLTSERDPNDTYQQRDEQDAGQERGDRRERYDRSDRGDRGADRGDRGRRYERRRPVVGRAGGERVDDRLLDQVDKLRRKQERLISLLVEKGVLTPGEVDGLDGTVVETADAYEDDDIDAMDGIGIHEN